MSTRCQIKLKNSEDNIYIYKHCDGYPEGVIPYLKIIVDKFMANRGYDECYMLAQIVRYFAVEEHKQGYSPQLGHFTGWGLDCCEHDDIEYLYEIDKNGDIFINNEKLTKKKYDKISNRLLFRSLCLT